MTTDLNNPLLKADSYKYTHFLQYPPGTEEVYAYLESRGGRFDQILWFGLQAILKEHYYASFTSYDIDEAEALIVPHGEPFNRAGFEYILNKHGGYWPMEIKALPEGMLVPTHVPPMTVRGTDSKVPWVPLFNETELMRVWYPATVATLSWHAKQIIKKYLEISADNLDGLPFKLHDFGARGVSSLESAALGGVAHLVNFMGTDTVSALVAANRWYKNRGPAGFSIPAAEHSTITAWGREGDGETHAYRNMLKQFAKPGALVAVVSDSYDIWNAIDKIWGETLKQEVIDSGAIVVVRPDSGIPTKVVPEVLQRAGDKFGWTINTKGYRVLNHLRVIQGDGIDIDSIPQILQACIDIGYSTDNLAMGMGGGLLQKVDRDTQKWAMKASSINVGGTNYDINKDPVTDPGKASKKGRFAVISEMGKLKCVPLAGNTWQDELRTVWKNGELLVDDNFSLIRDRSCGIMVK